MGAMALAAAQKGWLSPHLCIWVGSEYGFLALDPLLWEEPLRDSLVLKG